MTMKKGLATLFLFMTSPIVGAEGAIYVGVASSVHDGLEVGLGYVKHVGKAFLTVNYLSGVIYLEGPDPRYGKETFSNGETACRDASNGQFSDKEKCESSVTADYEPSAELAFYFSEQISAGIGYRGGENPEPYGMLTYHFRPKVYAVVRAASNYTGASIGLGF